MPRSERLGPALLLVLLALSLAITVLVYRERSPDLALEVVSLPREITPDGDGKRDTAPVEFFVRFDEPDATIEIVGAHFARVRTLASGFELAAGETVRCIWDARDDAGELAPLGHYRLRVVLPGQERSMVFPRKVRVVPPPAGDGREVAAGCAATGAAG